MQAMEQPDETTPLTDLDTLLMRTEEGAGSSPTSPLLQHQRSVSMGGLRIGSPPAKKGHRRHKSSLGHLWGSISDGLETIVEGVQAEAELFRGTLAQELEDADQGRKYFLDMGITRSLSVLPESIRDFADEAVGKELKREVELSEANLPARFAALLGAVLAVSSNGTALALLHGVPPALKLYWRMTATAMVLSVFALRTVCREGLPKLSGSLWSTFAGAVVCYATHALLFFFALSKTSIGNAVIGANSQAILLVFGKLFMGEPVDFLEGGGVAVAFAGVILCSGEEAKDSTTAEDDYSGYVGDIMALASGVMGVGYLTFAKVIRPHMKVTLFMFLVMIFGSLLILSFMLVGGLHITFSRDPYHGVFGWLTDVDHHVYVLLYIALVCNVCGTMGFVRAMQFFDNIIIAVATLLEPMIATMIAYIVGVGDLPGAQGWAGNALVALGTLAVVYPSLNKPLAH